MIYIVAAFYSADFKLKDLDARCFEVTYKIIDEHGIRIIDEVTWGKIPGESKKQMVNVIIVKDPSISNEDRVSAIDVETTNDSCFFANESEMFEFISTHPLDNYYVIGCESLYTQFLPISSFIYTLQFSGKGPGNVQEGARWPIEKGFRNFRIISYSRWLKNGSDEKYRIIQYEYNANKIEHGEQIYIDHMKNIIENGDVREDRTGTGTTSIFGGQLRFDISKSVPILTTKFVPFQLTVKELLFFLKGQTDSKILENQNVNIWKGNTSREFLNKRGLVHYDVGDMGPMYGFAIRNYSKEYKGCDYDYSKDEGGYDQLEELIKGLKEDPWSRRHLLTTYYIPYLKQSVLYPCHGLIIQFQYIEKVGKKYLSCHVYIRSSDGFLGLPINILSYAILTYIIAKKCGYLPYELIISFGDAHIYENHKSAVVEQLSRNILPFPVLEVSDDITNKDFKDIELFDFTLIGYLSHPPIKAVMAI